MSSLVFVLRADGNVTTENLPGSKFPPTYRFEDFVAKHTRFVYDRIKWHVYVEDGADEQDHFETLLKALRKFHGSGRPPEKDPWARHDMFRKRATPAACDNCATYDCLNCLNEILTDSKATGWMAR